MKLEKFLLNHTSDTRCSIRLLTSDPTNISNCEIVQIEFFHFAHSCLHFFYSNLSYLYCPVPDSRSLGLTRMLSPNRENQIALSGKMWQFKEHSLKCQFNSEFPKVEPVCVWVIGGSFLASNHNFQIKMRSQFRLRFISIAGVVYFMECIYAGDKKRERPNRLI